MPKNHLAVLVPLTKQEMWQATHGKDGRQQARVSVWSTVTRFLQPYLGKEFSMFSPAVCPWGHPLGAPFGVMLGAPETGLLLHFYSLARKAQSDAVLHHYEQIGNEGEQVAEFSPAKGLTFIVKAVDMSQVAQMPAFQWCERFMRGELTADTGLYYYGLGNTHVEEDVEKRILSSVNEFALCAVELDR